MSGVDAMCVQVMQNSADGEGVVAAAIRRFNAFTQSEVGLEASGPA